MLQIYDKFSELPNFGAANANKIVLFLRNNLTAYKAKLQDGALSMFIKF